MVPSLPEPLPVEGAVWRPATEDDAAAIVTLQDECFAVDDTYREVESEVLERFSDEMIHAPTDSLLCETESGSLIASVWSLLPTTAE
ncbi:MAG: hypothetical protein ACR2N2_06950, partial [Acidimicrobiia bacterium]